MHTNEDMKKELPKQMCDWFPCNKESKYVESSGDGRLVKVCLTHRRLLNKQKKVNNNS